jgi:hypothetical protein
MEATLDTLGNTAAITKIDQRHDAAMHWPQFSERELGRLRFLAHRCQMGGLRRPAPVRAEVEALCTSLLANLEQPDPEPPRYSVAQLGSAYSAARGSVPLLWAAWAEKNGWLQPNYYKGTSDGNCDATRGG